MERRSRGGVARRPRAVVAALMLALSALGVVLVVTLARPSPAVVDDDEPAGPSTIDAPREPEERAADLAAPKAAARPAEWGSIRLRLVRAVDHEPVPGIPVALRGPPVEDGPTRGAAWSD